MLKSVILRKFLFVVGFFLVTLFFNLVHFVDKLDFTKYSIEEAQSTKISKKLTEFFLYNKDEITPKVQLKKARIYSFKIIKAPLDDPYITVLISMYEGEKNKHYLMNERISYLVKQNEVTIKSEYTHLIVLVDGLFKQRDRAMGFTKSPQINAYYNEKSDDYFKTFIINHLDIQHISLSLPLSVGKKVSFKDVMLLFLHDEQEINTQSVFYFLVIGKCNQNFLNIKWYFWYNAGFEWIRENCMLFSEQQTYRTFFDQNNKYLQTMLNVVKENGIILQDGKQHTFILYPSTITFNALIYNDLENNNEKSSSSLIVVD